MRTLVFIFSLTIVGCTCLPWNPLNTFQETFWEVKRSAEHAIESVEQILHNRTEDSLNFIMMTENRKMVKPLSPGGSYEAGMCLSTFERLKQNFRMAYNNLEFPLLQRITEIRQRLSGISSILASYHGLADNKYWNCQMSKTENCTDVVERWLEQQMLSLSCEIVTCESRIIRKRQLYGLGFGEEDPSTTEIPSNIEVESTPVTNLDIIQPCYGSFRCFTTGCVDKSRVCDGVDDCGDNSDEDNCPRYVLYSPSNCSLELGTYLCGNRKCVSLSSVCDGTDDCEDGSDEGGNCTRSCQDCHPRGVCFRTPGGAECLTGCPRGTFETASSCQSSLEPEALPVSQLVSDMTRLISRHSAAYLWLKTRTISEVFMLLSSMSCQFSPVDMITKLKYISNEQPENSKESR